MAHAPDVLRHAIAEAHLLLQSGSLGTVEHLHSLLDLAQTACAAGVGQIADDEVRASSLHWTKLEQLGLSQAETS